MISNFNPNMVLLLYVIKQSLHLWLVDFNPNMVLLLWDSIILLLLCLAHFNPNMVLLLYVRNYFYFHTILSFMFFF